MHTLTAKPDLDAYLRLIRAAADEWQAALRELLHCDEADITLQSPQAVAGSLSSLRVERGALCLLTLAQDAEVHLCGMPGALLMVPLAGHCELLLEGERGQPVLPMAVVSAHRSVSVRAEGNAQLMLLRPHVWSCKVRPGEGALTNMASRVTQFLRRASFFRGHDDACRSANALFDALDSLACTGRGEAEEFSEELDRRLARVIDKIHSEPAWEFNLQELASHSGVSERNLYYLMKRETGMTPYRFYQRCRLVRVRRRLVDCQCDVPHISWYAADEGFSHLGRFAALYREHFGELPSETVQWRRRLQAVELTAGVPDGMIHS
ncbi:AraC family transcriptional regulator [Marinobacter daepoensis]|uniref:AraC family transcriptional regulator n=1 Tax=Marinobacter daepoensis TaxID=262077 RepID=UPI0004190041|nr:AraC family transcriptional regulator [Marinobacter daepoensis]MBY6033858.1 AraC family transcriptional regulator [Marinobacter daepoensis]